MANAKLKEAERIVKSMELQNARQYIRYSDALASFRQAERNLQEQDVQLGITIRNVCAARINRAEAELAVPNA